MSLHCENIMNVRWLIAIALLCGCARAAFGIDEFEQAPINYSQSTPKNRVSQLQSRLDRGEVKLSRDDRFGYLASLLQALDVQRDSQTLVFSKTSMQRGRITPQTPRALYFNDDVYVGYCHEGQVLEISAVDPQLGAVFYTLDQTEVESPKFVRQTDSCLLCHGSSQTDNIPGHRVRSLYVDSSGQPVLALGSHRVDHTTPIEDRWGGWYVTGSHGSQTHLGNLVVAGLNASPPFDNASGHNLLDLSSRFPTERYLTPHSDIVALMVLEHQTLVHNLLTQANYKARQALHYEAEFNRSMKEPPTNRLDSTTARIHSAGDKLLEGLLFVDEAKLKAPIKGSTEFAKQFVQSGPRDRRGRSLRDFDLTSRMFKYPCSYLIDSDAFDQLPTLMKSYVAQRLHEVLTSKSKDDKFAHLSQADRLAILEILSETKPELWTKQERRASGKP